MRFIEAVCRECKMEFKISFKKDESPYVIKCPLCGGSVRYIKINGTHDE